jgi:hypothetical protein
MRKIQYRKRRCDRKDDLKKTGKILLDEYNDAMDKYMAEL